jgi:rhamnosyltransferase subunit B
VRVFISAIGSLGDVNPMITLGTALKRRGHQVALLAVADALEQIKSRGLHAHCVLGQQEYDAWRALPRPTLSEEPTRIRMDRENMNALTHVVLPAIAETIQFVWRRHIPGRSIGLTPAPSGAGFAFLRERLQMPVFEVRFAPRDHENSGEFDNHFGTLLDDIRSSIDLPPLRQGWLRWLLTYDRAIGLYPSWFSDASRVRQSNVVPTTYLFESQDDARQLPAELDAFLAQGPPPVVATFGTYASFSNDLYRRVIDACTALRERLVIATRYPEQLPAQLPTNCITVRYVSFKRLLPCAAAIIHHGGAGTIAGAFRAGIPQIICPMAFDQFDNADTVVSLGCGLHVDSTSVSAIDLQNLLQRAIRDPQLHEAARKIAGYFDPSRDASSEICRLIEQFAHERGVQVQPAQGQL